MEPLLAGKGLSKSFGGLTILSQADFLLHPGEKVALVGPNGCGKTTVFRMLVGETAPDLGEILMKSDLRFGYLPQVPNVPEDRPVREVLAEPNAETRRLERELVESERWMASPDAWDQPDAEARMTRYGEVQMALGEARSKSDVGNDPILSDLGVPPEVLEQRFGSLSGGEKSKVLLARALANAKEKDLILLDEPTNHMDIDTIDWIEGFLGEIEGAVLLSSHDKFLLDNVATKILEIDHRKVREYEGNYTEYRVQREAHQRALEAQRRRNFDEVKRQMAIIDEFRARKRFTQIRSRKKEIERLEAAAPGQVPTANRAFQLVFKAAAQSGRSLLRLEDLSKSYGERLLFRGVSFELEKGDKLGLVGPNGCGKTTLLEILIGRRDPDSGTIERSKTARVGYFAQESETLDLQRTLLEEIRSIRRPPPPEEWARGFLGRFHFQGGMIHHSVGKLSGGERARLALAKFIAQEYNLLVLDEPTNHLDIESQEVVAAALKEYPGTVVIVSHNRSFLNDVVNKIGVIANQKIGIFQGTFKDSWMAVRMGEFLALKKKPRYRVLRVVKDWESGKSFQKGDTLTLTGVETQAFLRLLRWAEGVGRVERLEG